MWGRVQTWGIVYNSQIRDEEIARIGNLGKASSSGTYHGFLNPALFVENSALYYVNNDDLELRVHVVVFHARSPSLTPPSISMDTRTKEAFSALHTKYG
jgi:hypothetical protein